WERVADDVTRTDLSRELRDYEERREMDRRKLEAMVRYCRTAQCRTRMITQYFGEPRDDDFRCGHCDNDALAAEEALPEPKAVEMTAAEPGRAPGADLVPGEEVSHGTYGRGVVLSLDGERIEVDFGGHGVRTVRRDRLLAG